MVFIESIIEAKIIVTKDEEYGKKLKDLNINGLILRTVYDSLPLKVNYKLADYGYTLVPLIIELTNW